VKKRKGNRKGRMYRDAGVDIQAGEDFVKAIGKLVRRTKTPRVMELPNGFAGLFRLDFDEKLFARRYRKPVLAACTDGVGTKLKVAFAMRKYDTVGIDLVAMSVNDLIVLGAEPLFFLDYLASGKIEQEQLCEVMKGIAEGCVQAGCALLGGETAEMPGFYSEGEFDLAGFAVGVVPRHKIVDGGRVVPGDVVIGLNSSGLHSNGYSLVRKVLLDDARMSLDKKVDEFGCTLGEELLRPTKIYAKIIEKICAEYKVKRIVKAIAHITGGGLIGNVPRVLPGDVVVFHRDSWEVPPIFELIQKTGGIDTHEMYHVFNMGIGMTIVVPPYYADAIVRRIRRMKWGAGIIGKVVSGKGETRFD
jgi:phosphoribosylformylglycinamidine cyclo-ligase